MSSQNKPQRYILLDTNIFEHLGNEDLFPQIIEQLRDALSKNYGLSMSIYTLLELIDTASVENEVKAMSATSGVKRFKVNHTLLIAAGRLGCLYKDDGLEIKKQPERGDKIIAATAVLNNAIIYTTNGRDFPRPFFKTISKHILVYKKSDGRDVCIIGYFLEPDLEIIARKYQERIEPQKKKASKNK